jgi:DinB family protein
MKFAVEESMRVLTRTPDVIRVLLADLPETWWYSNYGPGTWSPHEVVGHLIHGEQTDWIPRARHILERGESPPFQPFDRNGHAALCHEKRLPELLDLFGKLREENLATLRSMLLTPESLAQRGTHPALGSVTLAQLVATWTVHDLNHISQICRALAYQYKAETGPWEAYLSILAPPAPR